MHADDQLHVFTLAVVYVVMWHVLHGVLLTFHRIFSHSIPPPFPPVFPAAVQLPSGPDMVMGDSGSSEGVEVRGEGTFLYTGYPTRVGTFKSCVL